MHPIVRSRLLLSLIAFLFAGVAAYSQQVQSERRLALVMGVGDYRGTKFPPLPGIGKDLERMKAALTQAGFQVIVVENPSISVAEEAIESFGTKLKAQAGGVGLFYFSGHGGEFEGKNYLIPKGARISSARDVKEQAVAAQRVLNQMEEAGARVNVVFLDCCRNDLTKAGTDTGLAAMTAKGVFIGFATGADKVSAASEEGSPYTTFLARRLLTPGISITDMHTQVTADVEDFTKERGMEQTPFQYSGLRASFYFVPSPTTRPSLQAAPAQQTHEVATSTPPRAATPRIADAPRPAVSAAAAGPATPSSAPMPLASHPTLPLHSSGDQRQIDPAPPLAGGSSKAKEALFLEIFRSGEENSKRRAQELCQALNVQIQYNSLVFPSGFNIAAVRDTGSKEAALIAMVYGDEGIQKIRRCYQYREGSPSAAVEISNQVLIPNEGKPKLLHAVEYRRTIDQKLTSLQTCLAKAKDFGGKAVEGKTIWKDSLARIQKTFASGTTLRSQDLISDAVTNLARAEAHLGALETQYGLHDERTERAEANIEAVRSQIQKFAVSAGANVRSYVMPLWATMLLGAASIVLLMVCKLLRFLRAWL